MKSVVSAHLSGLEPRMEYHWLVMDFEQVILMNYYPAFLHTSHNKTASLLFKIFVFGATHTDLLVNHNEYIF